MVCAVPASQPVGTLQSHRFQSYLRSLLIQSAALQSLGLKGVLPGWDRLFLDSRTVSE